MHKFEFLEKRDNNGVLLKFQGYEHAQETAEKCIKILSKSEIYKLLCEKFHKKYIEAYFSKMIFNELVPISHQIVINKWEKINSNEKDVAINTNSFFMSKYLNTILNKNYNFVSREVKPILTNLIEIIDLMKQTYYGFLKFINIFNKKNSISNLENKNFLAVCYAAGVSPEKRSDLFWFNKPNANMETVLLYAENPYTLRKYGEEKLIKKLEKDKKIKFIKIWKQGGFKKKIYYQNIKRDLSKISSKNYLDKILLKKSFQLIKKIEFWENFFEKYNIKVHIDIHESGNDTLAKQIAINLVNGCSFGRTSSYISNAKGIHYNYYPNDIFFCWGEKGVNNMIKKTNSKTHVKINNLLIGGYPYDYNSQKSKEKVEIVKKKFQTNNTKFNILLLDSSTSENQDYFHQILTYKKLENYYQFFLNWVIQDHEVGLIIKPKRIKFLKKLTNVNLLLKKALQTGRCHIVEDELGIIPWHYSKISNLVAGVHSSGIPSGILDCVLNNKNIRAVFFDYPNLRKTEPDLYSWGENQVVFESMKKMMKEIKNFKLKPDLNKNFGIWPKNYLKNLDPYNDGKSSERIEEYLTSLLKGFNEGLKNEDAINIANMNFTKKWGNKSLIIQNEQ
jgi:hypothetical protein